MSRLKTTKMADEINTACNGRNRLGELSEDGHPLVVATKKERTPERRVKALRKGRVRLVATGLTQFVQLKFSEKSANEMQARQEAGSQGKTKKAREPKDFEQNYKEAMHLLEDGTHGIPCAAFRGALVQACKLTGFEMTMAKLCIFVLSDGFDSTEGTPLVRLNGKPEMSVMPVRNANKVCDLRARPLWREWSCTFSVEFDLDAFSGADIFNLANRAGMQVGVGEGRPGSKLSNGQGWGTFKVDLAPGENYMEITTTLDDIEQQFRMVGKGAGGAK